MRKICSMFCLLFIAKKPILATAYETQRDIVFANPGGVPLKLDAYLVEDPGTHPAVIYVHGGGFVTGDKAQLPSVWPDVFKGLLEAKISVISVNYRLAPQFPYPAATDDVQSAIAFIKKNADDLRVAPNRLALMGESAGGMIVSHAGAKYPSGNQVAAVVSFFGEHDFELRVTENPCAMDGYTVPQPEGGCISGGMAAFLGFDKLTPEHEATLKDATCVTHVHAEMPAYLLVHGTRDYGVPIEQAHSMHQAMENIGADCTLVAIVGGGHGGWSEPHQQFYKEKVVSWLSEKLAE